MQLSDAFIMVMFAMISLAGLLTCLHYDKKFERMEHKAQDDYDFLTQRIRTIELYNQNRINDGK